MCLSTEYISKNAAITVAAYAADEHPYDKNPGKPETFSEYNQGWNDACDYIRERLEDVPVGVFIAATGANGQRSQVKLLLLLRK